MNLRNSLYKRLLKAEIISPKVIALLDGGICSQMHQFLLGQLFAERGYEVRYDLSFYEEWGSDLNGQFVRSFDLLQAFPYLHLKVASQTAIEVYKRKFYYKGNNSNARIDDFSFLQRVPPIYLGGYYHLPPEVFLSAFRTIFKLSLGVLDNLNEKLCCQIKAKSCSVAVHVRRGDLIAEVYAYGKPASLGYFQRAISFFKKKNQAAFFYFFSDEPDWVIRELLPTLFLDEDYKVVTTNGSDRGYMDLFLMASCNHQITSKGTLGKYGALLMDCPEKYVVLCDDVTEYMWKDLLQNPIFL